MLKKEILILILLLFISYFPIFLHLDALSIRMWDEARPAVSALEMATGEASLENWLVLHFNGQPDLYFTKPPFLIWIQAICMKIFGFNELAVRLPVALASLGTVFLLFYFGKTIFNNLKIGLLSGVVLLTIHGYIDGHVARTGDVDGFMIFWVTLYSLFYFKYLHADEPKKKSRYLLVITIGMIGAVLTKGVGGLLVLPGLLFYTIIQKKLKQVISSKQFYTAVSLFFLFTLGYYLLREYYNPGYLNAVYNNELGGRYVETIETHKHGFFFYFKNLFSSTGSLNIEPRFLPWVFYLPFCIAINYFHSNKLAKQFTLMGVIFLISHLLLISFAQTKIKWYDAPIYPIASIVLGIALERFYIGIIRYMKVPDRLKYIMFALFMLLVFGAPYVHIIEKVYRPSDSWDKLQYGYYLKEMAQKKPDLKKYTVSDHGYNAHLLFYNKVLNIKKKHEIKIDDDADLEFTDGEIVVTCMQNRMPEIEKKYNYEIIYSSNRCKTYRIIEKNKDGL